MLERVPWDILDDCIITEYLNSLFNFLSKCLRCLDQSKHITFKSFQMFYEVFVVHVLIRFSGSNIACLLFKLVEVSLLDLGARKCYDYVLLLDGQLPLKSKLTKSIYTYSKCFHFPRVKGWTHSQNLEKAPFHSLDSHFII